MYKNDLKQLIFIGGPCVIESEKMAMQIAEKLKKICNNLDINYIFKASFDKANRSSLDSFRGPGFDNGIKILLKIKKQFNLPLLTDVHTPEMISEIPQEIDYLQIPAFLSRQTDFYINAAKYKRKINIKKGQFMSPWEMKNAISKFKKSGGKDVFITERGTFFGYNNLVVDFRSIKIIQSFNVPYIYDATHSLQLPAGEGNQSGGLREYIPHMAYSQIAAGADGIFMEIHPDINKAKCDKGTQFPLNKMNDFLTKINSLWNFCREQKIK